MSMSPNPTPAHGIDLPDDPEEIVDELAAETGEDYDPPDRVDPGREAAEADMIDQAAEVRLDEDETGDSADD